MQELIKVSHQSKVTSKELVDIINHFRREEAESLSITTGKHVAPTELLHKSLLTKIEAEFDEEISRQNILPSSYLAGNGRYEKCYELDYDQSLQLLMSESKTVRKACVAKIKELTAPKKPATPPIPATYGAALLEAGRLAIELETTSAKLIEAETTITEQAPKVEFFNQVMTSTDTLDMGQVAKMFEGKIGRNRLFALLRKKGMLMHDNTPYQNYVSNGYFKVVESAWTDRRGETHIGTKTVVFQKGVAAIERIIKNFYNPCPVLFSPSTMN